MAVSNEKYTKDEVDDLLDVLEQCRIDNHTKDLLERTMPLDAMIEAHTVWLYTRERYGDFLESFIRKAFSVDLAKLIFTVLFTIEFRDIPKYLNFPEGFDNDRGSLVNLLSVGYPHIYHEILYVKAIVAWRLKVAK